MDKEQISELLLRKNINPTAIRILVLRSILEYNFAFSLLELEDRLETVDRSTLFRTLNLFHKKLLLHTIEDGSGSIKYARCPADCNCGLEDIHLHFYCNHCQKLFCLKDTPMPLINLPDGFILQNGNLVLKGICSMCSEFAI